MKSLIELEGANLGEKHQHYNRLVNEAVTSDSYKIDEFNIDDGDIENLLKIDIASKKEDVDYIMKVLVCDDMLYVSRAIKQSQWLINNIEYSNIISPEYLHDSLFPQMNTKSVYKFTKYIQLNLQDTARVEQFYDYEKSPERAVNWLSYCSEEFILRHIAKHVGHIKISQIRRLCEKTIMVLEVFVDTNIHTHISKSEIFQATLCLLNAKNIDKYLDLVEKLECYEYPKFKKSATSLIMKLVPKRIFDKFENYCNFIHLPTFIKFLKRENVKKFILDQASKSEELNKPQAIFNKHILKYFLESMPSKERYDFIREIFIDKIHKQKIDILPDSEIKAMSYIYNCIKNKRWFNELQLYEYAPFDIAFSHIKNLINQDPEIADKPIMFSMVIKTTRQNQQNIYLLLQYFKDKQHNMQYDMRYLFIKTIVNHTDFYKFNQNMWNVMEDIMMLNILESENECQMFLEAIIIYKVLNSQTVPEIIERKFQFNSLNSYINRMDLVDKDKLFNYLHNHMIKKLQYHNLKIKEQFHETIKILDRTLNLLNDWNKDLKEYPFIITTIKDIVNVNKENTWNSDLSCLYNKNKSWKKILFEESFHLHPCQSVFVNAIKHDSTMFERYKFEAEKLFLNEKETIIQVLRKIKIYWPQSLTKVWTDIYTNKLNYLNSQKASSRGVCILLSRPEFLTILNKYAPDNPKIDYDNINELNLNLQRCFAKNMHIARPQPPPETILLYAKGDYLKCSMPSLLSIYHNLSRVKSGKYIPELLNAHVSLQKHAIRFSFIKLNTNEIPLLYANVWETSKNITIKSVLFKTVYDLLCKESDPLGIDTLWNLLEMFIEHLTFNEHKNVYETLCNIDPIPIAVRAKFFIKSYTFLKKLSVSKKEYEVYGSRVKYSLFPYAREIMDTLPPSFVTNMLLEFINGDFTKESGYIYTMRANMLVLTSYLLTAKDEHTQMNKYEEIFFAILKHCSTSFKENKSKTHCHKNLEVLLDLLCEEVAEFFKKKMILPIKMFSSIQEELEKMFSESEDYLMLTKWSLAVTFTKTLNEFQGNDWNELCLAAAPQFGKQCHQNLQDHCKKYFPRIYILFAKALESVLQTFIQSSTDLSKFKIYECLLHDKKFLQGYLTALQLYPKYVNDECTEEAKKLRLIMFQHPSLEVKMHCHNKFSEQ